MLENNYGHIVNICSSGAYTVSAKASIYCATKAAVFNLTYALNMELLLLSELNGISFTCVCPGRMEETGMGCLQLWPWKNSEAGLSPNYVAQITVEAVKNRSFFVDVPQSRFRAILRL